MLNMPLRFGVLVLWAISAQLNDGASIKSEVDYMVSVIAYSTDAMYTV